VLWGLRRCSASDSEAPAPMRLLQLAEMNKHVFMAAVRVGRVRDNVDYCSLKPLVVDR